MLRSAGRCRIFDGENVHGSRSSKASLNLLCIHFRPRNLYNQIQRSHLKLHLKLQMIPKTIILHSKGQLILLFWILLTFPVNYLPQPYFFILLMIPIEWVNHENLAELIEAQPNHQHQEILFYAFKFILLDGVLGFRVF